MRKKIISLLLVISFMGLLPIATTCEPSDPEVLWLEGDYDDVDGFWDGLSIVKKDEYYYGFIDRNGKEVIPCIYYGVKYFSEGLAAVLKEDKWGYIDTLGNEIVPFIYDKADRFREGLAEVGVGEEYGKMKYGFIDPTGKEVIPLTLERNGGFSEGLAINTKDHRKWGFVDKTGKTVIPYLYDWVEDFSEGLAVVKVGDTSVIEYGIIYERGDPSTIKYGHINKEGNEVIPFIYDDASSFLEGLAVVGTTVGHKAMNDYQKPILKYGYIDKSGNQVIPCIYDSASRFDEGLAVVGTIVGYETKKVPRYIFSDFESGDDSDTIYDEIQEEIWKYGYIDQSGKEVIPCIYDSASQFYDGLAIVKKDGKWGLIKNRYALTVSLNGKMISFDQNPIIEDNRSLVPLRAIFEAMGATVSWDESTQTVTATKGDITLVMQIGNPVITKNDQPITLSVPSKVVNGRTLVPVRAIAEGFDYKVDWDEETMTVIITSLEDQMDRDS